MPSGTPPLRGGLPFGVTRVADLPSVRAESEVDESPKTSATEWRGAQGQAARATGSPGVSFCMQVTVNGDPHDLPKSATVGDLLTLLRLDRAVCAVEVNHAVLPKRERDARPLAEGDRVEIVTLVGGG